MKNSKYRELLKNTGILTIGNFSSKILIFFMIPIYTAALSTEEYGFYELTYTTIQLVFPILTLNVVDGLLRFVLDKENDPAKIYNICDLFSFISCGIVGVVLLILFFCGFNTNITKYALYIFLYYAFFTYNSLFLQVAKATDNVKSISISGIIGSVFLVGALLLLLVVFETGLVGFYIANIISQAASTVYYIFALKPWQYKKKDARRIDPHLLKRLIRYSIPLLITALCWWVNSSSDKYVVSYLCGIGISGLLSIAYKIPNIISTVTGIFTQAWQISAIKECDGDNDENFYKNTFLYLNICVCLIVAIAVPLVKPMAKILFAKDYFEAWRFIPFLMYSTIFNVGAGFLAPILNAGYNGKAVALSGICGMVINIGLNIALTLWLGAQGVTIATIASSFIIYYVRKIFSKKLLKGKSYNKIVVVWLLILASVITYTYTEFWWISLGIAIIVLALFIVDIITLFKNIKAHFKKKEQE